MPLARNPPTQKGVHFEASNPGKDPRRKPQQKIIKLGGVKECSLHLSWLQVAFRSRGYLQKAAAAAQLQGQFELEHF